MSLGGVGEIEYCIFLKGPPPAAQLASPRNRLGHPLDAQKWQLSGGFDKGLVQNLAECEFQIEPPPPGFGPGIKFFLGPYSRGNLTGVRPPTRGGGLASWAASENKKKIIFIFSFPEF